MRPHSLNLTTREPAGRDGVPAPVTMPPRDEATSRHAAGLRRAAPRRRRWRWIAGGAAVVLVSAGALVWARARESGSPEYVTEPVTRGTVASAVTASGSVNPVLTVQVGSYVSGIIESISCDFNTAVHKGQVCATIDPRPYQTVVEQDRANLATAQAQLDKDRTQLAYAQLSYQRATDLQRQSLVSQDDLDSATSAFDQATAQVALDQSVVTQREAALQSAEVNVGYTRIVSPVDGVVVSRNVTVGQTVAASFQTPTLFLIANDLTKMQVDASVSESDIGSVRTGDRATFTVDAFPSHPFEGLVAQVRQAPQSVQNVVTYDVVIDVANPDRLLKPGMTAAVHIVTSEREHVLRVPDRALRFSPADTRAAQGPSGGAQRVWILRDGQAAPVPVTVGLDDGTSAEVTGGDLNSGDRVIVSERADGPTGPAAAASRPPRFGG
jgi:HlyD family secretion protein